MRSSRSEPPDQSVLTPEEVRTATFSQAQLAWRGYSEDEVRAYLNRLADSMVAADQERVGLRREVERLRNFYRDHGQDVDLVSDGAARHRFDDGLLNRVRGSVDVQVGQAREYADLIETGSDEQANIALHHGCVRTELAVEESLRRSAIVMNGYAVLNPTDLDRASSWLSAFYLALRAQLQKTNDALTNVRHGSRQRLSP